MSHKNDFSEYNNSVPPVIDRIGLNIGDIGYDTCGRNVNMTE